MTCGILVSTRMTACAGILRGAAIQKEQLLSPGESPCLGIELGELLVACTMEEGVSFISCTSGTEWSNKAKMYFNVYKPREQDSTEEPSYSTRKTLLLLKSKLLHSYVYVNPT